MRPVAGPSGAGLEAQSEFAREVMAGLSRRDKSLPCRFFYDDVGSELFEEITRTQDYYPTRTETAILRDHAKELMQDSARAVLVEFGSGSSTKTELLLAAAPALAAYVPIDVSQSALNGAERRLAERFPRLTVSSVVGNFASVVTLPAALAGHPRIGFFPGSTIGNFAPDEARALLRTMAQTLGGQARLVVGYDLRKDTRRLLAAYNDAEGVTAEFNLNLLARINRELGGTFDLQFFRHEAIYEPVKGRIEMYLISERAQVVEILGTPVTFAAEERIHTENSYKYSPWDFDRLAVAAGWRLRRRFVDAESLFCVTELVPA
jgi:dimethylhistidine N-methyltransferase